ncbi:MAG: hypothetical protein ABIP44_04320, partial [Pseudoxanthomonas sp.]
CFSHRGQRIERARTYKEKRSKSIAGKARSCVSKEAFSWDGRLSIRRGGLAPMGRSYDDDGFFRQFAKNKKVRQCRPFSS